VQFWSGNENSCTLPGCATATVTLPGGQSAPTKVTINYTYDPLYRLTAADYSDGKYFHYTYDAVGNRLTQDANLAGQPASTNYSYDSANRLTSVGGVSYTWDANGNLLNDGANAYAYDSANRLTAVSGKQEAVSYAYDGLGNRLQQVVNGNKTTYVNDLNAGLTQILSDGTNTYLYGNDRIAQLPADAPQKADYFLGDALGSVRQMADGSGEVDYAASYDPYGNVLSTTGEVQTNYGYTNEYTDSYFKLIDLRSRQYSPETGRFLTKDSWQGNPDMPQSLDQWSYTEENPINSVDPSGHITIQESSAAENDVKELTRLFNVQITIDWGYILVPEMTDSHSIHPGVVKNGCMWYPGNWRSVHELDLVLQAVKDLSRKFGPGNTGTQVFKSIYNHVLISRWPEDITTSFAPPGNLAQSYGDVVLSDATFPTKPARNDDYTRFSVVHELGHVWDYRSGNQLSLGLMEALHSWVCDTDPARNYCYWDTSKAIEPAPDATINCNPKQPRPGCLGGKVPYSQTYGGAGPLVEGPGWEDWAQSLAYYVYPSYDTSTYGLEPTRRSYVEAQFQAASSH
jgi:RHS repeat-associated protein